MSVLKSYCNTAKKGTNQDKKVIYEVASTYKSFENLGIKIISKSF